MCGRHIQCDRGRTRAQICDVDADDALGLGDYPLAIRLHTDVLRLDLDNALAHYHLEFTQGMEGNRAAEISEHRRAEALGLKNWDLFLNLGVKVRPLEDEEDAFGSESSSQLYTISKCADILERLVPVVS